MRISTLVPLLLLTSCHFRKVQNSFIGVIADSEYNDTEDTGAAHESHGMRLINGKADRFVYFRVSLTIDDIDRFYDGKATGSASIQEIAFTESYDYYSAVDGGYDHDGEAPIVNGELQDNVSFQGEWYGRTLWLRIGTPEPLGGYLSLACNMVDGNLVCDDDFNYEAALDDSATTDGDCRIVNGKDDRQEDTGGYAETDGCKHDDFAR